MKLTINDVNLLTAARCAHLTHAHVHISEVSVILAVGTEHLARERALNGDKEWATIDSILDETVIYRPERDNHEN